MDLRLFGLGNDVGYARRIGTELGVEVSPLREEWRPDGEAWAASLENVRGRDVFVVSSLDGDRNASVNDKTMRLLLAVDALKRASAGRVTAVCPYLSYTRQDRKEGSREPVSTQALAKMFEAVGTDRLLTMDPHNPGALQNAFRIPIDLLEARKVLADAVAGDVEAERAFALMVDGEDVPPPARLVVVSPDAGGVRRAKLFQESLARRMPGTAVDFAHGHKTRRGGEVSVQEVAGDVAGPCVVVDDLVATAGTIRDLSRAIGERGGYVALVVATFGLFVGDAAANLPAGVDVMVTDAASPWRLAGTPAESRLRTVSTAGLFAEAIRRIHGGDGSISELLSD